MFISLVSCDNTTVAGVARGSATYHDFLFQIDTPPGGGTPGVDHELDAYWAWLLTDNPSVHESLTALGMFQPFDPDMSLTASSGVGGLTTLQGHVSWPDSPFSLQGTMLDNAPPGVPPDYQVQFWQDVPDGVLLAKLQKHGETWRYANFTLSTPVGSKLASMLGDQCTPTTDGTTCSVSGQGTVTNLTNFVYDITVLGQEPSGDVPEFSVLPLGMGLAVLGAVCTVVLSRRRRRD